MNEERSIEQDFFPRDNYELTSKFPQVIEALKNLNFESLNTILDDSNNWIIDDSDYTLTREYLEYFLVLRNSNFTSKDYEVNFEYDEHFVFNFAELGRYFLTLHETYNETESDLVEAFSKILQTISLQATEPIEVALKDYPDLTASAMDWLAAATIIEWLEVLSNYYVTKENYNALFNARLGQLKMTIASKPHYPEEVAWAMLNFGVAAEMIEQYEHAVKAYEAIVGDYSFILDEEVTEENDLLYNQVLTAKQRLSDIQLHNH